MEMPKNLLAASAVALSLGLPGFAFAQEVNQELAAEGESVWRQCQACHQVGEDAQNRVGPHLNGVVGRTAGTAEDYSYSEAMVEAGANGLTWTEEELSAFLENPREHVPGTKMTFAGIRDEQQRLAVIEYVKANGGAAQ